MDMADRRYRAISGGTVTHTDATCSTVATTMHSLDTADEETVFVLNPIQLIPLTLIVCNTQYCI